MTRWPQQTSLASSLLPFFPVLILPKFIPVNLLCCCCCSRGSFFFFLRFFSSFILWKLILKWMVHSQWDNIKDLTVISHSHKSELLLIQEHRVSMPWAKQRGLWIFHGASLVFFFCIRHTFWPTVLERSPTSEVCMSPYQCEHLSYETLLFYIQLTAGMSWHFPGVCLLIP